MNSGEEKELSYILLMQSDTNTKGYTQWFYFMIDNPIPHVIYTFEIINFRKKHSFFREGKKPLFFSQKDNTWAPVSGDIIYSKSRFEFQSHRTRHSSTRQSQSVTSEPLVAKKTNRYYSLTFQAVFHHAHDRILIAQSLPYSYTRLINSLRTLQIKAVQNNCNFELAAIGHTLANNGVPYICIGKKDGQTYDLERDLGESKSKAGGSEKKEKSVIILARQHPGETWSSFLVEEMMRELISAEHYRGMLQEYKFHIFPMVNVDGVIYGNSRCDLAGYDLNRTWKDPSLILHPQIYLIKKFISQLSEVSSIQMVLDFHGHSKDYNIFAYACNLDPIHSRVFPFMLARASTPQDPSKMPIFSIEQSTFGIEKGKESTARAVLFSMAKCLNVLTIEISAYGLKKKQEKHDERKGIKSEMSIAEEERQKSGGSQQNKEFGQNREKEQMRGKMEENLEVIDPQLIGEFGRVLVKAMDNYLMRTSEDKQGSRQSAENHVRENLSQFLEYQRRKIGSTIGSDSEPDVDEICLAEKLGKVFPKNLKDVLLKESLKPKKLKKKLLKKLSQQSKLATQIGDHQQSKEGKDFSTEPLDSIKDPLSVSLYRNPTRKLRSYRENKPIEKSQSEVIQPQLTKFNLITEESHFEKLGSVQLNSMMKMQGEVYARMGGRIISLSRKESKMKFTQTMSNPSKGITENRESQSKYFGYAGVDSIRAESQVNGGQVAKEVQKKSRETMNLASIGLSNERELPQLCILPERRKKLANRTREKSFQTTTNNRKWKQFFHRPIVSEEKKVETLYINTAHRKGEESKKTEESKKASSEMGAETKKIGYKIGKIGHTRDKNPETEVYKKLKEKERGELEYFSKIWRENLLRYGQDLGIFTIKR